MRLRSLAIALFATLLVSAPPASATVTPSVSEGKEIVLQSDGAGDTITLQCVGGQARAVGMDLLPCSDLESLFVFGGGASDTIDLANIDATTFPALSFISLNGEGGEDNVKGTQLRDTITADFEDSVTAGAGADSISGGALVFAGDGDDLIESPAGPADGGGGDDFFSGASSAPLSGGTGFDTFELDLPASATANIEFALDDSKIFLAIPGVSAGVIPWSSIEQAELYLISGGTQTVDGSAFSGTLRLDGRGGPDILIGGPGEDVIIGGSGDDQLEGGAGIDHVNGGFGNDQLRLRDGASDSGLCGAGSDSAVADTGDLLSACESVDLPVLAPAPPAGAAPRDAAPRDIKSPVTRNLKGPKKVIQGKLAVFRFASSEPRSTFRCRVDKQRSKPCRSPFKLKTKSLAPGKHIFSVFAVDAAGNADGTPLKRSFTVQRAKGKSSRR